MKTLFSSFILLVSLCGSASASIIDINKVFVPAFKAEAQILSRGELKVTEAYLEYYTDFIQCLIACNYDLQVSTQKISFSQISPQEVIFKNPKSKSIRFQKIVSRVNECGASLVVKGKMGAKSYFTRVDLYKLYSKNSKNDCARSDSLERSLEDLFARPLELKRWIQIDSAR